MGQLQIKLIMFDLDGTLVDSAPEIAAAANLMLADLARPVLPVAQIKSYIGEGVVALIKRCLTSQADFSALDIEPDEKLMTQAESFFVKHYADCAAESKPFSGVIQGLQMLHNLGFKLACVTNKPEKFTLPLLQKSGLIDFFEMVVAGDTLPKKKPDPMQLRYVCEKLSVPISEALLVGDSNTDIEAASAAGCFIITVPYGYNQGGLIKKSSVNAMIEDLTQLASRNLVVLLA